MRMVESGAHAAAAGHMAPGRCMPLGLGFCIRVFWARMLTWHWVEIIVQADDPK